MTFLLPPKILFEIVLVCKNKTHKSVNKPMGKELELFNRAKKSLISWPKVSKPMRNWTWFYNLEQNCNRKNQFDFRKQ